MLIKATAILCIRSMQFSRKEQVLIETIIVKPVSIVDIHTSQFQILDTLQLQNNNIDYRLPGLTSRTRFL